MYMYIYIYTYIYIYIIYIYIYILYIYIYDYKYIWLSLNPDLQDMFLDNYMKSVLKPSLDNWVPIDITSDVQIFFFLRGAGDDILGILTPLDDT